MKTTRKEFMSAATAFAVSPMLSAAGRAEVTLFAQHSPVAALKPLASMDESQLRQISYEAAMPSVYCPSKGLEALEPVYVRPGEKARIELTVHGPVSKPTITCCGEKWTFDVDLGRHDRLYCRDGISWHVARGPKRRPDAAGRLDRKLPVLMGGKTVLGFESAEPGKADSRIDIVKRYTDGCRCGQDSCLMVGFWYNTVCQELGARRKRQSAENE